MQNIRKVTMLSLVLAGLWGTVQAQEPAKPGKEHKFLKEMYEGEWDANFGDGKGSVTCKMDLNGLWLFSTFKGDFGGMPFEGRGADGYDINKKKFVGAWLDSMESGMMTFEGTYDEKTKTLTHTGIGTMHGKPAKLKMVTVFKDKNEHNWKMFMDDGTEPVMQITYTRKK
jgi:hypothetical protein